MIDFQSENQIKQKKSLLFKIFGLEKEEIDKILFENGIYSNYRCKAHTKYLDTLLTFEFEPEKFTYEIHNIVFSTVYKLFGDNVYVESDESLGKIAIDMLKIRDRYLSVAESLTGGLICDKLVEIAGASKVFLEGAVTYSNQAKTERLGVPEKMIEQYGAVSEEVSVAMCKGLTDGRTDYALSTTGIAGPDGGSLTKPLGLCYISVGNHDNILTKKFVFSGDRSGVRHKCANTALYMLINFMKSH